MIKLLQWNIWFKEDIDNIVKQLEIIDADIVCIQELSILKDDRSNTDKLKKIYQYMYYEVADTFMDGRSQGNAILSKYPIIKTTSTFVQEPSSNKDDYSEEGRIYIEVQLDIGGKKLNVGTTHLSYTNRFEETELKDKEVDRLIKCFNKDSMYIFAGDLNASKTSKYIKKIQKYLVNHDTSNTWTTKPFSYQGFEESKLNWKLDYVFSTRDIVVYDTRVIKTHYSDHLPILCTFQI